MLVKELIELLKKMPPESRVVFNYQWEDKDYGELIVGEDDVCTVDYNAKWNETVLNNIDCE